LLFQIHNLYRYSEADEQRLQQEIAALTAQQRIAEENLQHVEERNPEIAEAARVKRELEVGLCTS
jgi:hypothetical protein